MRHLPLLIAALMALTAPADDTTRDGLRRRRAPEPHQVIQKCDTLPALGGEITISGYDKPLDSRRETFHVTSTMPDSITGLVLRLTYTDVAGRRLHEVTRSVNCIIPPYDTRLVTIPSFDTQCRYFYARGKQSRASGVTPFEVSVTPLYIVIKN